MCDKVTVCQGCEWFEDDYVNDDGDWVEGWGCCALTCPEEKGE